MSTEVAKQTPELRAALDRLRPAGEKRAAESAALLINAYPKNDAADPGVYVRMIAVAFARYPADLHLEAIDRLTSKLRWLPTKADVVDVLEELVTPRRLEAVRERKRAEQPPRRSGERVKPEEALAVFARVKAALAMPDSVVDDEPRRVRPLHVNATMEQREAVFRKRGV